MLENADYSSGLQRYTCFAALLLNNKTSLGSEGRRGEKKSYLGEGEDMLMKSDWEHLEAVFRRRSPE